MKVWKSEMLAESLAGHDKGALYVVLCDAADPDGAANAAAESSYVLLADGRRRTLDHPKKKKQKHVQMITHLPEALLSEMRGITQDAQVRSIIKSYKEGKN